MSPWFEQKPERIAALIVEAGSWMGTPFFPNSSSKHRGASCHKLVGAIYDAVGFGTYDVPDVPMTTTMFRATDVVEKYLAARPEFVRVEDAPRVGDLLGFRIGKSVHHLGILIGPGVFIHAIPPPGVVPGYLADATWAGRHAITWRPSA